MSLKMDYTDRVKGMIFGAALGDSLGAYFEFRSTSQIQRDYIYPKAIDFPPLRGVSFMKRDTKQHWTDSTSQMILIMDTIIETGKLDLNLLAKKLVDWKDMGFPEFGETKGLNVERYTSSVLSDPMYLQNPLGTSQAYSKQCKSATNGSLSRSAVLAARGKKCLRKTLIDAMISSRLTHYNNKCTNTVKIYTDVVWSVLNNKEPHYLDDSLYRELIEMSLDDKHMSHVLKTSMIVVWAYFHMDDDFKETIQNVVFMGGSADNNACVTGAILGARIGYSKLPTDWLGKMPNHNWLMSKVEKYLTCIDK
jgi:ADP-ribosylglycohydrolase